MKYPALLLVLLAFAMLAFTAAAVEAVVEGEGSFIRGGGAEVADLGQAETTKNVKSNMQEEGIRVLGSKVRSGYWLLFGRLFLRWDLIMSRQSITPSLLTHCTFDGRRAKERVKVKARER